MINALALCDKFWPILALDHGLTVGHRDSVSIHKLPDLLEGCQEDIGSVVMTYGLARLVRNHNNLPLIVQCFGAPFGHPKVQVCSVERALGIDAKGVAVQVDFSLSGEHLCYQLKSVAKLVGEAHEANLPVLFMIAPQEAASVSHRYKSIRFCIELGADLIKVRCNVLALDQASGAKFEEFLRSTPPILLTGGAASSNILSEVSKAQELGFSGYCIGRNIFKASNPLIMTRKLRETWQN